MQLLVVFGFFGFSILTWVVRQLKEKSIARRQQQMRAQRHIESLRTGRVSTDASPPKARTGAPQPARPQARSPEQRLAEIAARRATQKQAGTPTGVQTRTAPSQASNVPQRSPTPQAPTRMPRPGPAGGQVPNQPKTTAQRRQEMIEARRRALEARQSRSKPEPTPPKARRPERKPRVSSFQAADDLPRKKVKPALTRKQLRQAIVFKELLDPPIALREEGDL